MGGHNVSGHRHQGFSAVIHRRLAFRGSTFLTHQQKAPIALLGGADNREGPGVDGFD